MNEEDNNNETNNNEPKNNTRRHFLRNTAVTGVAGAGLVSGFGAASLLKSNSAQAANAEKGVEVAPGELDEYYGFWSEVTPVKSVFWAYPRCVS